MSHKKLSVGKRAASKLIQFSKAEASTMWGRMGHRRRQLQMTDTPTWDLFVFRTPSPGFCRRLDLTKSFTGLRKQWCNPFNPSTRGFIHILPAKNHCFSACPSPARGQANTLLPAAAGWELPFARGNAQEGQNQLWAVNPHLSFIRQGTWLGRGTAATALLHSRLGYASPGHQSRSWK